MTEADTLYIMSYTGYMHSYVMSKDARKNPQQWSIITHSAPFLFPDVDALGRMQMSSTYNLEPADMGEKQSYCTYMLAPPKK